MTPLFPDHPGIKVESITPLFSKGLYDDLPEIRPPSIRGQLHDWFRRLGYGIEQERRIFGSVFGDQGKASPLVVRVAGLPSPQTKGTNVATCPHKSGGFAASKAALPAGTGFTLQFLVRHPGLNTEDRAALARTVETWLLLGGLGLRCTRGGGSLRAADAPASLADYREALARLTQGSLISADVLDKAYTSAEDARRVITDTLGGPNPPPGARPLADLHNPLGGVGRELHRDYRNRKTSPLRLRVAKIGAAYHIVASWDGREKVTGNTPSDLREIIGLLGLHNKALGPLLSRSALATL